MAESKTTTTTRKPKAKPRTLAEQMAELKRKADAKLAKLDLATDKKVDELCALLVQVDSLREEMGVPPIYRDNDINLVFNAAGTGDLVVTDPYEGQADGAEQESDYPADSVAD